MDDEENMEHFSGDCSPEKLEEKKLMKKLSQSGGVGTKPPVTSQFIQKRLQQRKYFDSGDYNMAIAKGVKVPVTPTKTSVSAAGNGKSAILSVLTAERRLSVEDDSSACPTGYEIPTPESVPHRKTSLIQTTASKLSPQPLIHLHSPTSDHVTSVLEPTD